MRVRSTKDKLTVGDLTDGLEDRSHAILIAIFSLPFLQPVPLPGFSTPMGLAISLIGIWFSFGKRPWMPQFIRHIEIQEGLILKIIEFTEKLFKKIEKFIKPRLTVFVHRRWMHIFIGAVITLNGLLLALPLPIPFTNALPGWSLLLIALSLIEDDGLLLLFGLALAVTSLSYIFAVVAIPILLANGYSFRPV